MMAEAQTTKSQEHKVRLSNAAIRALGKLRDRGRKADEPVSFDDYLAARPDLGVAVDLFGVGAGYGTAATKNTAPSKRGRPPEGQRHDRRDEARPAHCRRA